MDHLQPPPQWPQSMSSNPSRRSDQNSNEENIGAEDRERRDNRMRRHHHDYERSTSSRRDHRLLHDHRRDHHHRDRSRDRDRSDRNHHHPSSRTHESDHHHQRRRKDDRHHHSTGSSSSRRHRSRSSSHESKQRHHHRHGSRSRHHHRGDRSPPTTPESGGAAGGSTSNHHHPDGYPSSSSTAAAAHVAPFANIRILRASRSPSPTSANMPRPSSLERHQEQHHRNSYFVGVRGHENAAQHLHNHDADDFDKEQIHREMQERLTRHLAREGKVYPPPKPQAQHPIFANDGSFLETFKRLQEHQTESSQQNEAAFYQATPTNAAAAVSATVTDLRRPTAAVQQPMFGKRRGGKILKTGIVAKQKMIEEDEVTAAANKNDAWAMYLHEVKKYKSVSCDTDAKTRPLVK